MQNLVIVESPAKAKTISKFLGTEYKVLASMGHVRDLPKTTLGFDPADNFKPQYQISADKKKVIAELKKNINKDTIIYLASDEDREGEAISWHLIDALKIQKNPLKRIVFHEITKDAIIHAMENPREVDQNLVDAQQARRILDRAVGYKLSPLLWKKIRKGLSAGRVQSVAVRIIVDREREIRAFTPTEFWKVKANFIDPKFGAELVKTNGKATKIPDEKSAKLIESSLLKGEFFLKDIEEKESTRMPSAPFTTSTLQQEASRKLGFSVAQTMMVAQQLYEGNFDKNIPNHTGGLITYMRTDSVNLSNVATKMAKEVIDAEYGSEYSLKSPRVYKSSAKGAQEAHEAIRPVDLRLKPSQIKPYVDAKQFRLYELIWKRTLATQMANAKLGNTTYIIEAGENKEHELQAKGQRIIFAGFMKAYTEGSDDPEAALDGTEKILPSIKKGTTLSKEEIILEQHYTKPPARYTEASLVKKLESEGIGRPSTYAPTISTIQTREYVIKTEDKKLAPTDIGELVNDFLVEHFPQIVDLGFTAKAEEEFDLIAEGKIAWTDVMREFYTKFVANIEEKEKTADRVSTPARVIGIDPQSGKEVLAKVGRFGPYVQIGEATEEEKPKFVSIPKGKSVDTITLEEALSLFSLPRVVGQDKDGNEIVANIGRYGPYLQVNKKFISIKKDDPYTIELDRALEIIDEEANKKQNEPIKEFTKEGISVLDGRYGPYIKKGKKNYKIPKGKTASELTLEEVLEIIAKTDKK
ncbi:MAG: type I DNA topoisomerase [Campylobacterota bacterium]